MEISRRTSWIIGIIGVVFGIGGLFIYQNWPERTALSTTLLILAAVHLLVFFITHFEAVKTFSQQRSTQFGANTLFMAALLIALLGMTNFIVALHEMRLDFSSQKTFTLSPQTLSVLKALKQEIKISGFFAEGSNKVGPAKDLFENYRHQSRQVTYEIIDPDKKPAVAKQYGVTEYDTVVLESKGQSAMVRSVSEEEMTSAILRVSRESKKQFYFIEGHGEHPINDTSEEGYSFLKESLERKGFSVKKWILLSEKKVPEDAAVVIVGGPQKPYAPEEQETLNAYLTRKGQLFLLLDPMVEHGLEGLLSSWGVLLEKDLLLDPSSGLGAAVPIVTPDGYLPHEITRRFNLATFYSLARSVAFDTAKAKQIRFDSFLQTGPKSWAIRGPLAKQIAIDPSRDRKGPIVFGGVFSLKRPEKKGRPGEPQKEETVEAARLVVLGDSDFASNRLVRAAGNGDLFQNIVSWLAQEHSLVSIGPKEGSTTTLLLSNEQKRMLFYSSVVALPIGTLLMGLVIVRRRRWL